MAHRLDVVSAERIRDELHKLLVVDDPAAGLWFLHDTGLFEQLPARDPGAAPRAGPDPPAQGRAQPHDRRRRQRRAPATPTASRTLVTRMAALLHDIAKPRTRGYGPKGVTFHHHEVVGARMARARLQALRESTRVVDDVTTLVELHLRFHGYGEGDGGWTDAAVRRFVRDAGHLLDELIELTRSDCTTRNERKARMLQRRMDDLVERIARLREEEELAAIRPDLDGERVMAILGIRPGPRGRRGAALPARAPPRRGPARRRGGRAPPAGVVGGSRLMDVTARSPPTARRSPLPSPSAASATAP